MDEADQVAPSAQPGEESRLRGQKRTWNPDSGAEMMMSTRSRESERDFSPQPMLDETQGKLCLCCGTSIAGEDEEQQSNQRSNEAQPQVPHVLQDIVSISEWLALEREFAALREVLEQACADLRITFGAKLAFEKALFPGRVLWTVWLCERARTHAHLSPEIFVEALNAPSTAYPALPEFPFFALDAAPCAQSLCVQCAHISGELLRSVQLGLDLSSQQLDDNDCKVLAIVFASASTNLMSWFPALSFSRNNLSSVGMAMIVNALAVHTLTSRVVLFAHNKRIDRVDLREGAFEYHRCVQHNSHGTCLGGGAGDSSGKDGNCNCSLLASTSAIASAAASLCISVGFDRNLSRHQTCTGVSTLVLHSCPIRHLSAAGTRCLRGLRVLVLFGTKLSEIRETCRALHGIAPSALFLKPSIFASPATCGLSVRLLREQKDSLMAPAHSDSHAEDLLSLKGLASEFCPILPSSSLGTSAFNVAVHPVAWTAAALWEEALIDINAPLTLSCSRIMMAGALEGMDNAPDFRSNAEAALGAASVGVHVGHGSVCLSDDVSVSRFLSLYKASLLETYFIPPPEEAQNDHEQESRTFPHVQGRDHDTDSSAASTFESNEWSEMVDRIDNFDDENVHDENSADDDFEDEEFDDRSDEGDDAMHVILHNNASLSPVSLSRESFSPLRAWTSLYRSLMIDGVPSICFLDNEPVSVEERIRAHADVRKYYEPFPNARKSVVSSLALIRARETGHVMDNDLVPARHALAHQGEGMARKFRRDISSTLVHAPDRPRASMLFHASKRPRQFEYNPHEAGYLVLGTLDGKVMVIQDEAQSLVGCTSVDNDSAGGMTSGDSETGGGGDEAIGQVLGLCWLNKDSWKFVAGTDKGVIQMYDVNWLRRHRTQSVMQYAPFRDLTSLHVNCTDERMIVSGYEKHVSLYDLGTGVRLNQLRQCHSEHINVCKFSHFNPNLFATSSFDTTIKLWDLRETIRASGEPRPIYSRSSHGGNVMLCFAPNDEHLLVSAVDNEIRQYVACDGRLATQFAIPRRHSPYNYTRAYYMNGSDYIVAGSCEEDLVRVCCAKTGRCLREYQMDFERLGLSTVASSAGIGMRDDETVHMHRMRPQLYVQSLRGDPFRQFCFSVLLAYNHTSAPSSVIRLEMMSPRDEEPCWQEAAAIASASGGA
ncbi:WD repeat-containing protein 5B [Porphyridium purpureum]|uniref:WD repeat-containing protein 5B n=1 Tax=Porphyridium purpureum TaxID=35688 RepID=A0A5J4Z3L8_PORPP|nr:WD repeat-containing protein 5B [Porphyridium purpureum]|eukprot:POR3514..scf295_1